MTTSLHLLALEDYIMSILLYCLFWADDLLYVITVGDIKYVISLNAVRNVLVA